MFLFTSIMFYLLFLNNDKKKIFCLKFCLPFYKEGTINFYHFEFHSGCFLIYSELCVSLLCKPDRQIGILENFTFQSQ